MPFTAEQVDALKAKLDPRHVAERAQAGRKLSYIEGWHAIAEANRIFGFDAWTRETLEIRRVAEHERPVGQGKGWGVSYVARVRVTVAGIVREGVGAGHGIDRDLGLAHESAIKEAETDAMKRALMTFGNPFGLALYDKSQANVGVTDDGHDDDIAASMLDYIAQIQTAERAAEWWASQSKKNDNGRNAFDRLSNDGWQRVEAAFKARRKELLTGRTEMAA